jgi:hypothetical protein
MAGVHLAENFRLILLSVRIHCQLLAVDNEIYLLMKSLTYLYLQVTRWIEHYPSLLAPIDCANNQMPDLVELQDLNNGKLAQKSGQRLKVLR